jgi:prohibitin 1
MLKNGSILLCLLMVTTMTGCGYTTLEPGERGVKVEMGKLDRAVLKNGITYYNPITTQVYEYDIKQHMVTGETQPLTSDQQPLSIGFKIQYRIPEGQVLNLFENVKGDPLDVLVQPQIQEAFRQVVSQHNADYTTAHLNELRLAVLARVREGLQNRVEVIDIPITHVTLPKKLQDAIMEKQTVEIEAKRKLFELQREKIDAQVIVAKARGEAEKTRLMNEALKKSPELVKFKLAEVEMEKAKRWNGVLPQTVMGNGSNMLFSLR